MRRLVWLLAASVSLGAGCSALSPRAEKNPNALAANAQLDDLDRAQLLYSQGDYVAATIEYHKVIECGADEAKREEARIGAAKSLVKMRRLPAAMTALGALPAAPASEFDSRKLAIAGEIYLRQHRPKEAEVCLELALDAAPLESVLARAADNAAGQTVAGAETVTPAAYVAARTQAQPPPLEAIPPGTPLHAAPGPLGNGVFSHEPHGMASPPMDGVVPPPPWMAGCCANLGCAYLKNDKPEKAAIMYGCAAQLFRAEGDRIQAERAQRVSDDLCAVLRQYGPFKPPPLTQRLPPGKK